MSDEIEMMRARLRECERERDAANEAACIYAERGARFADDADRYQRERDAARAEVARLTARLRECERERDEAQQHEREAQAQSDLHHRLLMETCDERDAARAACRARRARLEAVEAGAAAMREALNKAADEPYPNWNGDAMSHNCAECAECKEWKERKHPLQHSCDAWYREYYALKASHDHEVTLWSGRRTAARKLRDSIRAFAVDASSVPARHAAIVDALETIANWPGDKWNSGRLDVRNTALAALFPDAGRALLDRHAADIARKDAALADVADYRGGADCACRDEHVMERVRAALLPSGGA